MSVLFLVSLANLKEEGRTGQGQGQGQGQWSDITSLLDIFFNSSQTFDVGEKKTWIQKSSFNGRQIYKTVSNDWVFVTETDSIVAQLCSLT